MNPGNMKLDVGAPRNEEEHSYYLHCGTTNNIPERKSLLNRSKRIMGVSFNTVMESRKPESTGSFDFFWYLVAQLNAGGLGMKIKDIFSTALELFILSWVK